MQSSIEDDLALSERTTQVGRYVLHAEIARGGMATVHAARVTGAEGFHRLVAAKRLHPEFAEDPELVTMFHDEARIASRIHHPNVVPVLDVVVTGAEVMLVQEYVHGAPLSVVMRRARTTMKPIPTGVSVAIVAGILAGLHAAHEARDELGTPLDVIHRDVSPQNVMLSAEGVPRLLDFGIAKARTSAHQTRPGVMKGKLNYMAPEQIKTGPITRRADIYATGVVLWELLANRRIGEQMSEADYLIMLYDGAVPTLVEECSAWRRSMGQAGWKRLMALDAIVTRALSLDPAERFATALEMAEAVVAAHPPASQSEVASWLAEVAGDHMTKLRRTLAQSEEEWRSTSRLEAATMSRRIDVTAAATPDPNGDRVTVPTPRVFFPVDLEEELRAAAERGMPESSRPTAPPPSSGARRAARAPDDALFVLPRSTPRLEAAAEERADDRASAFAELAAACEPTGQAPRPQVDGRRASSRDAPLVVESAHESAPPESVPAVASSDAPRGLPTPRRPWPRLVWIAGAAAVALALGYAGARYAPRGTTTSTAAAAAPTSTIPPLPAALLEIAPLPPRPAAEAPPEPRPSASAAGLPACTPAASASAAVVSLPAAAPPAKAPRPPPPRSHAARR